MVPCKCWGSSRLCHVAMVVQFVHAWGSKGSAGRTLGRGAQLVSDSEEKWEVSQFLFADDTVLVADSKKKLEMLVEEFGRVCRRRKLKVNVARSKVMRSARDGIVGGKLSEICTVCFFSLLLCLYLLY